MDFMNYRESPIEEKNKVMQQKTTLVIFVKLSSWWVCKFKFFESLIIAKSSCIEKEFYFWKKNLKGK